MNTDQIAAVRKRIIKLTGEMPEYIEAEIDAIIKAAIEKAWQEAAAKWRDKYKVMPAHASDATKDADGRCIRCGQSPSFCKCTESAHASTSSKCSQCGTELQAGSLTVAAAHASDTVRLDELGSGSHFSGEWSHVNQQWTVEIQDQATTGKTIREGIDKQLGLAHSSSAAHLRAREHRMKSAKPGQNESER